MNTSARRKAALFGLTLAATIGIGAAAASPVNAATCASTAGVSSTVSTASVRNVQSAAPASALKPDINVWSIYETNIGSEIKCEALLKKMKAAYPKSYSWECLPYSTSTCPSFERWQLWYTDGE
jgi:hypothetical protein